LGKRAAPERQDSEQPQMQKDLELLKRRCKTISKQYYATLETKNKIQSKIPGAKPRETDDVLIRDSGSEFSFQQEPLVDLNEKYDMDGKQQRAEFEAEEEA
jgi:hypothetical protein